MFLTTLVIFISFCCLVYKYMTRNYGSFQARGIAEVPSSFPFGSNANKRMMSGKTSFVTASEEIYNEYKTEKMVGHFSFSTPFILVNDLELAKEVMIKSFDSFTDRRGVELDESVRANHLFMNFATTLKGEKWKFLRSIMSPMFTSGKLKSMTPLIHKVSDDLVDHMRGFENQEIDVKDIMTDFTLDLIASCGFGVEAKAFQHENNAFREMVRVFTGQQRRSKTSFLSLMTILFFPKIGKLLGLSIFDEESMLFLEDITRQTLDQRRREGVRRGDLIDLSMDAIRGMELDQEQEEETEQFEKDALIKPDLRPDLSKEELETLLVANILQMLQAGYETTSTIMSVVLFFLAKNPHVQDKVLVEIQDVMGGEDVSSMDYFTAQQKLPYLDMVIHESTRHYPLTVVERVAVKDYKVAGMNVTIPKGMVVQIPTLAIMKDERYFPDPERFTPEHFSPEMRSKRSPYAYLAFGQGPRNCVGKRFAMLQMKIALVRIVTRFRLIPSAKTVDRLVPDPISRAGQPIGGIFVKITPRRDSLSSN